MKTRILNYLEQIDKLIEQYKTTNNTNEKDISTNIDNDINRHLIQVGMFQHERFIHLIVTVLFSILTVMSILFNIVYSNIAIFILTILLIILLIPYIKHYYLLENSVQKMYEQYDKLIDIKDSLNSK